MILFAIVSFLLRGMVIIDLIKIKMEKVRNDNSSKCFLEKSYRREMFFDRTRFRGEKMACELLLQSTSCPKKILDQFTKLSKERFLMKV